MRNIMSKLRKGEPLFSVRTDIVVGRWLILLQAICMFIYGVSETIRYSMLGNMVYLIPISLAFILLTYFSMRGYYHKGMIFMLTLFYNIIILLMSIGSVYSTYATLQTGLSISKTEYFTIGYIIFTIIEYILLLLLMFFYTKTLPYFKKIQPAFYRYINIQNLRIDRIKREKQYKKALQSWNY